MADEHENKSNSTPVLAFVIGGLVVAVAIIAYFMLGGDEPTTVGEGGGDTNINVETSDTDSGSDSGEASGDSEPAAESGGESGSETTGETSN